jgi:ankyrin repeat protein
MTQIFIGFLFLFSPLAEASRREELQEELVDAAGMGQVEEVRALLARGADPNGHDGFYTPLVGASQYCRTDVIKLLIGSGADPNLADPYDRVPLDWAIQERCEESAHILVARGAELNLLSANLTMLEIALESPNDYNKPEQFKYQERMYYWLFNTGFDVHKAQGRPGDVIAAAAGSSKRKLVADLMARHDFSSHVNDYTATGSTPLIDAIFNFDSESEVVKIIRVLFQYGADPNLRNTDGGSPLSAARYKGRKKVIELLKKHGATG